MGNLVFLVGFMGSGKTTLAKKLANRLGIRFMDLDQLIVSQIGQSIPDYFTQYGEEAFRILEKDVLRAMEDDQPTVVAVGGGTPCFHDNMQWMNTRGQTIYLQMDSRGLWRRLAQSDIKKRPLLKGLEGEELHDFIDEKLKLREPYYLQAQYHIRQMVDSVEDIIRKCRLDRFRPAGQESQKSAQS